MPNAKNKPKHLRRALKESVSQFLDDFPLASNADSCNLGYHFKFHKTSKNNILIRKGVIGLIVETRPAIVGFHEAIHQVNEILNIPIIIIHGSDNLHNVKAACKELDPNSFESYELCPPISRICDYNRLLMSDSLYDLIGNATQLLVFQSDSLPCINSEYNLSDFSSFDYIGGQRSTSRRSGLYTNGGTGGFSLRNLRLSKLCLKLFGNSNWSKGEDGFFAFFMESLGGKVANHKEQGMFCSQFNKMNAGTFAVHKLAEPIDLETRLLIEKYCPLWLSRFSKEKPMGGQL